MTMQTWLAEYYPVPADTPMTGQEAIDHSRRKWEGLRSENLERHDLKRAYRRIFHEPSGEDFTVDANTCALCFKFEEIEGKNTCQDCPLFAVRGTRCDEYSPGDGTESLYSEFTVNGNPLPMIEALAKCE